MMVEITKGDYNMIDFGTKSNTSAGILNLEKEEILDLTKSGSALKHLILGAGWDVPKIGASYDLDIAAFLLHENRRIREAGKDVVYFRQKQQQGISLDKDNRTGAGEGDDERIQIDAEALDPTVSSIVFVVTIYEAEKKGQVFGKVKNAYVRLLDEDDDERVLCQFPLTDAASTDTAVIFCELFRSGDGWEFKAIGESCQGDLNDLLSRYM